ncbi:MAG: OsmC family protein [Anaerolineaceae bacterium]|nr:OsmC family protein [Anaerolineaceae bacterium]
MRKISMTAVTDDKKRVEVDLGDFMVVTDAKLEYGGEYAAPSPGATFLAGVLACTASTARGYCKQHNLPMPEKVVASFEYDTDNDVISSVHFEIMVTAEFPENRLKALEKAAGACTVKGWWKNPPEFLTSTTVI